jgi:hypothetical protein
MSEEVNPTLPRKGKVIGSLPDDTPPFGAMPSPRFQQFLTRVPATVQVFKPVQSCQN